ncbi:MAG: hypothetical protein ABH839_01215 [Chloroflexota bacterium]
MGIDWFRDLAICVLGLVATGVLILGAVILASLYRRTRSILDAVQATSAHMKSMTSYLESEVVKPVLQLIALVEGIKQGIDTVFKRKEEGSRG